MAKRKPKVRLTVTVDADLLKAANAAVRAGRAESMSALVNDALGKLAADERRRVAGEEAIRAYEAKFGVITEEEMAERERLDRLHAIRYRSGRRMTPSRGAARRGHS